MQSSQIKQIASQVPIENSGTTRKKYMRDNYFVKLTCASFVVVLCCLFLVSEFRSRFTLCVLIIFLVRFGLLKLQIVKIQREHMVK